ncbi:hypothetical protein [Streptomyces sp. NPDC008137]|uniref:hypothetical protein n=1 Tax=Streptomyces sp. NPDC008137 TaxID=3364813 RepID=UPI0036EA49AD
MIFFETEADPTEWFLMPLHWSPENERQIEEWSSTCAEIMYRRHKKWWRNPDKALLANRFRCLVEAHPIPNVPAHQAFLYGPDPSRLPQPFYALIVHPEGADRDTDLRIVVQATDKNAVRPPEVESFDSAHIGPGLRCLHYFGDDGELGVSLNYGWWSEEHQVYASIRTVTAEIGWLATNIDIFDDFARSIWLNSNPEKQSLYST